MKVFVSWSKNSRDVGKAMAAAVTEIFDPVVDTFISQEIKAGARALNEIDDELSDTDFGIICLTRANQAEQWINYEAGALSREVDGKRLRLGVFLVDFDDTKEVNSPMNIFQCKMATLEGMSDLMTSLNDLEPKLNEATLKKRISYAWPDLEKAVAAAKNDSSGGPRLPPKTTDEKLDELLGLVKAVEASLGDELLIQKEETARNETIDKSISLGKKWMTRRESVNDSIFDAVIDTALKYLLSIGDWGDCGAVYSGKDVTFSTERELPENVQDDMSRMIKEVRPAANVTFERKDRP
ncbi:hypothetical protein ACIPUB_19955 [Paeniglutamicibacter sp. ORCA_105]|uniref:hypothetical protein n=1 Tax=Paeniglutamicibacter sp. ORCA_105 TaxID=3377336 RepID=UPI0038950888